MVVAGRVSLPIPHSHPLTPLHATSLQLPAPATSFLQASLGCGSQLHWLMDVLEYYSRPGIALDQRLTGRVGV